MVRSIARSSRRAREVAELEASEQRRARARAEARLAESLTRAPVLSEPAGHVAAAREGAEATSNDRRRFFSILRKVF